MKRMILLFLFLNGLNFAQSGYLEDLDKAYMNALKGIHWALSNIPESKSSLNSDLIDSDRLVAEVKLSKEVEGVKIESKGVFRSYEVKIIVYRSYDSLKTEGF